jgi:hypothetical protein
MRHIAVDPEEVVGMPAGPDMRVAVVEERLPEVAEQLSKVSIV